MGFICIDAILHNLELQEIKPDDPRVKADNKLIPELLQKIKADDHGVLETYIQGLTASSGPFHTLSLETDMDILGDLVGSLLGNLFELLNHPTSDTVSLKDQMQVLYEFLRFLRTILKKQQEKFNNLDENIKDLVHIVVNDAGIIICSLFMSKTKLFLAKEVDLALSDLLAKAKLLKIEVQKKYPVISKLNFPRITEVDFTDNNKNAL